jgi:hypothetical protein
VAAWVPRGAVRAGIVLVAVLGALQAAPGTAVAHARLIASEPAGGSTLTAAPVTVLLRFSEPIEADFAQSRVVGPDGARVDNGAPSVSGSELRQPLLPLAMAGAYNVAFRVISADGHPVEGTIGFEFAPAPAPGPTGQPVPATGATPAESAGEFTPGTTSPGLDPGQSSGQETGELAAERQAGSGVPGTLLVVVVGLVVLAGLAFRLTRPRRPPPP